MKKFLCILIAMLLCIGNIASIKAISYLKGDVNYDGNVDISDLVYLQQFLNGNIYADGATAERLDVNCDYVINEYDKSLLSSIIMGSISTYTIESSNIDSLPAQESRTYKKYSIITGQTTEYTLDPLGNIPIRTIIGNNDRTLENGLAGVVKINGGTGFLVDNHTILTAAHIVKYGTTTNKTYGTIVSLFSEVTYADDTHLDDVIECNINSSAGDSGGPMGIDTVNGLCLLGILSGGNGSTTYFIKNSNIEQNLEVVILSVQMS